MSLPSWRPRFEPLQSGTFEQENTGPVQAQAENRWMSRICQRNTSVMQSSQEPSTTACGCIFHVNWLHPAITECGCITACCTTPVMMPAMLGMELGGCCLTASRIAEASSEAFSCSTVATPM